MTERLYVFYDSYSPTVFRSPYFNEWRDKAGGDKPYYTQEDIENLATVLSPTIAKRIVKIREGTELKLSYLHRCGNLMVRLLTDQEIERVLAVKQNKERQSELRSIIKSRCPEEHKELNKLQKELRKYGT